MILPYVYKMTHKITGQFYFGFRCANRVRSEDDLGIRYFTSSKTIKQNFSEYSSTVLAEFFNKDDAYLFEQALIKEHFDDPLILNRHWQSTDSYSMLGFKRPDLGQLNKLTKSKPKEQRSYNCGHCGNTIIRIEFVHHPIRQHCFCGKKCSASYFGMLRKKPKIIRERVAWNKGLHNPTAAENGRRGAVKLSQTVTGRKRKYREDGTWFWMYPEGDG